MAGLQRLVKDGVDFAFKDSEVQFIKTLDAQRPHKKTIFGSGFLVAEQKAAEQKKKECIIVWELSDREWEIVKSLG